MLSVTFHNSFFSDREVTVWIAISWQFEERPQLESGSWDWAWGGWSRWIVEKWVRWGRQAKVCLMTACFTDLSWLLWLQKRVLPSEYLRLRWSNTFCLKVNSEFSLVPKIHTFLSIPSHPLGITSQPRLRQSWWQLRSIFVLQDRALDDLASSALSGLLQSETEAHERAWLLLTQSAALLPVHCAELCWPSSALLLGCELKNEIFYCLYSAFLDFIKNGLWHFPPFFLHLMLWEATSLLEKLSFTVSILFMNIVFIFHGPAQNPCLS